MRFRKKKVLLLKMSDRTKLLRYSQYNSWTEKWSHRIRKISQFRLEWIPNHHFQSPTSDRDSQSQRSLLRVLSHWILKYSRFRLTCQNLSEHRFTVLSLSGKQSSVSSLSLWNIFSLCSGRICLTAGKWLLTLILWLFCMIPT